MHYSPARQLGRRAFLKESTLILGALAAGNWTASRLLAAETPALRLGLVTDVHYADRPPGDTRFYRESIGKLQECVDRFNRAKVDSVVELGDLIDAAETAEGEIGHLRRIEQEYARLSCPRHYVLGNHCVWTLTKRQFLDNCAAEESYYSFDQGGFHFIILDACFRPDGVPYGARNFKWNRAFIPPKEKDWLLADLKKTSHPTIIFIHQRLDVQNNYGVTNAPDIRKLLEKGGNVLAVFQGHNHINDYRQIGGVHYCTLAAVIEGSGPEHNAYGILGIQPDHTLTVEGFRQQKKYSWEAKAAAVPSPI